MKGMQFQQGIFCQYPLNGFIIKSFATCETLVPNGNVHVGMLVLVPVRNRAEKYDLLGVVPNRF